MTALFRHNKQGLTSLLFALCLFTTLIVITDRGIQMWGKALEKTPYWDNILATNLSRIKKTNIFIFGDCRARYSFNSLNFQRGLKLSTFNLGITQTKSVLGFNEFYINLLLSQGHRGFGLFVVTDNLLLESKDSIENGFNDERYWEHFISPKRLKTLNLEYPSQSYLFSSGLYSYFGRGVELVRSSIRWLAQKPVNIYFDNFMQPEIFNAERAYWFQEYKNHLATNMKNSFTPNPYAVNKLYSILSKAKHSGLQPILIIPPVHKYYSSAQFRSQLNHTVNRIALDLDLPFMNFQYPNDPFSNDDHLWIELVHLNLKGIRKFEALVMEQLMRILKKSSYIEKNNV